MIQIIINGRANMNAAFARIRADFARFVANARMAARAARNQFIAGGGLPGLIRRQVQAAGRWLQQLPANAGRAARAMLGHFRNMAAGIGRFAQAAGRSVMQMGRLAMSAAQAAAPMALLGGKIALAIAVILPLTGAIGNLIPLLMLLAPLAGTAGLAILGLKLAFNGMGEALQAGLSGDVEAFEKALKKLAPQAADTVRALVKVRDQWKDTVKGFQGRVFEGAASEITALSNMIKPIADRWLPRLGLRFAEVRNQLAEGLGRVASDGRLEAVWRNLHVALSDILDTVAPLGRAFFDILEVAAPRFAEVAGYIKDGAKAFSDWIRQAKESGKLGEWLDKAMTTFGKLKDILKNLSTAIAGIMGASSEGGDSMLDSFVAWTKDLSDWVNGDTGQQLIGIFSSLFSVLSNSAPIFSLILDGINGQVAAFKSLGAIGVAVWNGIVDAAKFAIMWILDGYGWLVNGAAKAFGWIPGIGDKLKGAANAFNQFRDQVNNSLNGIQKTVDITVNYRARMIGNHLVSGAQQSGTYISGSGGRAHGGNATGVVMVGERGRELVDLGASGGRVMNNHQTEAYLGGGGTGGGGDVNLTIAAGRTVGDPFAQAVLSLFKNKSLRLVDANGRTVKFA